MAKKVQKHAAPKLRRTFRQFRQWGVEMPGASEAMVHWRGLMEELAAAAAIPLVVAFDLDLANMYGAIEWPHIRAAVSKHFQEAEATQGWSRSSSSVGAPPSPITALPRVTYSEAQLHPSFSANPWKNTEPACRRS
jgi:hypothetical protein